MKSRLPVLLGLIASVFSLGHAEEAALLPVVRDDFAQAAAQYSGMLDRIKSSTGSPRTYANNRLSLVGPTDWTSGFFAGALWYLYEYTGEARWKDAAIRYTAAVEAAKTRTDTHDVGFIINCSFGQGYRLTGNTQYRDVLLTAAGSLSTRFNPTVGCIKSWDNRSQWKYPVIIDNMMNLELMMRTAQLGPVPRYADIAISHADKTLINHFRADASSYHVVSYLPETGAVEIKQTWQGAFDESAWARGQAWGLYGYTMMYRETHHADYLTHAKRIAAFLLNHPRMPADKVPYWDFDAPGIPNVPRDASAAAIMSSALIELSGFVDADLAKQYVAFAEQQLRSLSSPAYRARVGENFNFLLMHSTGSFPGNSEVDVPLIYADYYYLEALMRYKARFAPAAGLAPVFTTQPGAQTIATGTTAVFTASATGSPTPTYGWSKDGLPILGATKASFVVNHASAVQAGTYTCTATNDAGSTASTAAALTLSSTADVGRLTALSLRTMINPGAQTLIVGVYVGGTGTSGSAPLLVRAMGPSLAAYGVANFLADPALTVFPVGASGSVATNDNWGGDASLAARSTQVGTFPFASSSSLDAALERSFASGGYTVQIVGTGGKTGIALTEVYEATPAGAFGATSPRLLSLSGRAQVGTADNIIIGGFRIGGSTAKTVIIRGVGPTLASFGLAGALSDPKLQLFRGSELIAENDDWGGDPQFAAQCTALGAFSLDAASKDAAIFITLPPGLYSAQMTGVNSTTGIGLLEIYDGS